MKRRKLILVLISLIITINLNSASASNIQERNFSLERESLVINFPDPNLESAVRERIDKPTGDIYDTDVDTLLSCAFTDKNILDLTGLEYFTALKELYLDKNQLADLTSLTSLTNLELLELGSNQLSDISPLANLTKLRRLDLYNNGLVDLSALTNLTNLEVLELYNNQLTEIFFLANLTKLEVLDLGKNKLAEISSLANLTSLRELYLNNNQIASVNPLSNLVELELLGLYNNQLTDLSALATLTNLKQLYLENNQLSDLSALTNLTNLEILYLGVNQLTDISFLNNLTSLVTLDLNNNQLADITALANLNKIEILTLNNNQIVDIEPLVANNGLASGDQLDLKANPLSVNSIVNLIPILEDRGVVVAYDPLENQAPEIIDYSPMSDDLTIEENNTINFSVVATDADGDQLNYKWLVGGIIQNEENSNSFEMTFTNSGSYEVEVVVADAESQTSHTWKVEVSLAITENTPIETTLYQNYPNPFNPETTIKFYNSALRRVKLSIYNLKGEEVANLLNCELEQGFKAISFDATHLNSGVYYYKLETEDRSLIKKMVLLK